MPEFISDFYIFFFVFFVADCSVLFVFRLLPLA
jgi:hypothetical protein